MRNLNHKLTRFLLTTLVAPAAAYLGAQQISQKADLSKDWKLNASLVMNQGPEAYDNQSIMVKFHPGTPKAAREAVAKSLGGTFLDADQDGVDDRFCHIAEGCWVQIDLGRSANALGASAALSALENNPDVAYAQLNARISIQAEATPNDPDYGKQWALPKVGAPAAWDITKGSEEVVVGIIDTGLLYTHPDLKANVWVNPKETAGNGKDDDGNGYIDDVHGINAITGTGDPLDTKQGHGTHCAGIIGAVGNNGVGVTGINWNVKVLPMKFLNDQGSGAFSDAVKCINYAIGLKKAGVNIRVLSNSYGGGQYDQALEDGVKAAEKAGMLFVAAAGNGGSDLVGDDNDGTPNYPSNYEVANVLAVASTTNQDARSGFSNYGKKSVDMGAPGSDIYSTHLKDGYTNMSGTSMATPYVAGAAGLLLSKDNNLTYAKLKSLLMDNGDAISALSGKTVSGKRLNVKKALDAITSDPGEDTTPPTVSNVKTDVSGNAVTLSADAKDNVGVKQVEFSVDGKLMNTDTTSPYSYVMNNVPEGEHTLSVVAIDAAGNKSEAVTKKFTIGTGSDNEVPTVSNVQAEVSGTSVTLSADAKDNVGVKQVEFSVDGKLVNTDTSSPYSYVMNNVAAGDHTLSVVASDAAGNKSQSVSKKFTVDTPTGTERVKNGGFEQGAAYWYGNTHVISSFWKRMRGDGPYEGKGMAAMGGNGYTSVERLYQPVSIPSQTTSAVLTIMLNIGTSETASTAQDTLRVALTNANGMVLKTLATYSNLDKSSGYVQRSFDVSAYKGQSVRIHFQMNENLAKPTSFLIDNVSLLVK